MSKKTSIYKGLDTLNTVYTDSSLLSRNIFDISFFPNTFTVGKNLIKFRGNTNTLKVGASIDVEILDSNGDTIYSEFLDYVDSDGSRALAVYIYEDTAPGDATVIFVSEISKLNNQLIPVENRNQINVKWTRNISVNPLEFNTSPVIFDEDPIVEIKEVIGVQLDRIYENSQFVNTSGNNISFISRNNNHIAFLTNTSTDKFLGDMIDGTLTVLTPQNSLPAIPNNISPADIKYQSRILKVLNDHTLQLETPYEVFDTQSLFSHTFNEFNQSAYSINYEATPQYIPTQNSESFALIQLSDLDPDIGDISRVKVSINSEGTVGAYEQINDIRLPSTEIFIESTSSLTPDKSIGIFQTQSIIDNFWESSIYYSDIKNSTSPRLFWDTSSINNAVTIEVPPTLPKINQPNDLILVQNKDQYQGIFVSQSLYNLTIDAHATRLSNGLDPIIHIYASGSAFSYNVTDDLNRRLNNQLGKKIGKLVCLGNEKRYDDISFEFNSDQSGKGSLIFVIEAGDWKLSDIRTTSAAEYGYTPNYIRFRTEIPTKHKSGNELSFKIEYYNRVGDKSDTISFIRNLTFAGGNRYIDGGFNMLTGSLFVADTLSSGVEIAGLQNTGYVRSLGYEGFNQATGSSAGGFLLFSGSALPQQSATTYQGVGLEMVSDANNFFRYRTNPSILDVHTETFFLGNPSTQFISGSNGNLEISSSNFQLNTNGTINATGGTIGGFSIGTNSLTTTGVEINDSSQALFISSSGFKVSHPGAVTATSIIVQNSDGTLLNTNTGFSDGRNIARALPITSFNTNAFTVMMEGEQKLIVLGLSNLVTATNTDLSGTFGITFNKLTSGAVFAPVHNTGSWTFNSGTNSLEQRVVRHVVDLSSMGNVFGTPFNATGQPVLISVVGTNMATGQGCQVTAHRNVGAEGAGKSAFGGIGTVNTTVDDGEGG